MNSRDRLLNSIMGLETDRLAWSPFLAYFWDVQPEAIRRNGMLDFYKSIGADPLFRGYCTIIKKEFKNCQIRESASNGEKQILYETPVGTLESRYTYTSEGNTWFLTKHPVKTEEDYKILIPSFHQESTSQAMPDNSYTPTLSPKNRPCSLFPDYAAALIPPASPNCPASHNAPVSYLPTEQHHWLQLFYPNPSLAKSFGSNEPANDDHRRYCQVC